MSRQVTKPTIHQYGINFVTHSHGGKDGCIFFSGPIVLLPMFWLCFTFSFIEGLRFIFSSNTFSYIFHVVGRVLFLWDCATSYLVVVNPERWTFKLWKYTPLWSYLGFAFCLIKWCWVLWVWAAQGLLKTHQKCWSTHSLPSPTHHQQYTSYMFFILQHLQSGLPWWSWCRGRPALVICKAWLICCWH